VERLARASSATVILLHVIERRAPEEVHGDQHLKLAGEAERYLSGIASRMEAAGVPVQWHAHDAPEGDVARSIVQHQVEQGADLTAMCTHGGEGLRGLLFGRIAQQVLKRGSTPVLLVRPAAGADVLAFEPRTVLVPLDGTPQAEEAVAVAGELARGLGAAMHLLRVVPTVDKVRGDQQSVAILLPGATRRVLEIEEGTAGSYLEELAAPLRKSGLIVTTEVLRGDVLAEVVSCASRGDVDVVVLSTHVHTGIEAAWTGSVAGALLEHTRTPLLLIRRSAP
jgi:nucleotide-binding universal stress UspA family protein